MSPFLAWGDFHARSRFARPTIPEEKWGTTRSLIEQGVFTSYVLLDHTLFETFVQFHCLSSSQNNLNLNDLVLIQPHFPIMLHLQTYFELFMCTILQILNPE